MSCDHERTSPVPALTVIIPMREEERFVAPCLDSVLRQLQGRADVEILCAVGTSRDRTRDTVADYARRDPRVRLLDNPRRIVPTGMNLALRVARGDVLVRLDCHAEYAPDYLAKCLEVLQRTGADNVGGYMTTMPGDDSPVGRAIAAATTSRFGVGGSAFRVGGVEQEVDTVPFGCFRRDVFERFGCYDERLVRNQDIELNHRIRKGGGRIVISPEIKLTYYNRSTFAGLRQQAFHNGLWNPYTLYLVGEGLRLRHFVPLGFVLSMLILGCLGFLWRPAWLLLAAELVVYTLAAAGMAVAASRPAQTSALLVWLAFVQLHLSYGVGSLWGVLTAPFKFGLRPRGRGDTPTSAARAP
jgi:glycosyltransferase involved in cell wall biosynthesis